VPDLTFSRRTALAAGAAAAVSLATRATAAAKTAFPAGFLWGAASAAHQVEGGNSNSDAWLLEGVPDGGFKEPSLDACDHYNRYAQDVALLASLGLNTYRFSIEWARIEPVKGRFSQVELDHYRNVLLACRKHGLKTVVTLHHFTSPVWFARDGGFEDKSAVALFTRYAETVVRHCGDLIDYLCTFNEANLSFTQFLPPPVVASIQAAGKRASGSAKFSTFLFDDVAVSKPILRACHTSARVAIKAIRPGLPIGQTLAMSDIQDDPAAPGFGAAARSALYDVWLDLAKSDDFVGVQNYTRERFGPKGPIDPPADAIRSQLGQEVYAPSLAGAVRYAASVAKVPVLVTEHGVGHTDDAVRVRLIDESLPPLRKVMDEGVRVLGYIHWSAMDNFEWAFGYGPKFGLMAVDHATFARTVKPSGRRLGAIAKANGV
jgi:beta-glucosidase